MKMANKTDESKFSFYKTEDTNRCLVTVKTKDGSNSNNANMVMYFGNLPSLDDSTLNTIRGTNKSINKANHWK